jgi:hypothetical protein
MSDNLTDERFQTKPPVAVPNPKDWVDTDGAAKILDRSRTTVYAYVAAGVLEQYQIGAHAVYWVPDVQDMAKALRAIGR